MGEDILQRWIVELFRPLLERYLREQGETAFVGADQFIYYEQYDPIKRVSPDVYVLPGVAPDTHVPSWKVFETGLPPSFCLEVVSKDWEKDYADAPLRYDEAGVSELVIFDPHFKRRSRGEGLLFQVYRRLARRGFVRTEVTNEYRVRSKVLGCWLRAVGSGRMMRLRLGLGPTGDTLFPTAEEQALLERQQALAEREQALTRVAELEREVRALRDETRRAKTRRKK